MSLYESIVPQLGKMLENLGKWLDAGAEHAKKKSFEPSVLLQSRLALDQYPLVRQVQACCDAAKLSAARLTGKEAPKHPDTETTLEELHARIRAVLAYLATFQPADFDGAEERKILLPWAEGKFLLAHDYVNEMVLPNFYFHATTAYAILRHNGVDVGKRDFLGALSFKDV